MVHVVRYESPQAWAEHVAARFASFLADEPAARVALPTGATPEPVYAGIIEAVRAGIASFRRSHVFLLDEFGGVPPDAKGRCDVMLHRSLLDHVDLAPERYHRLDPEAEDLAAMCAAYDASMTPPLDMMVLGIGRNGHVGMNEPGTSPESATRRVELAPSTTQASVRELRRGRGAADVGRHDRALGNPRRAPISILATGDSKADIVRDVLLEPVSTTRPASLLRGHPMLAVPGRRRRGETAGRRAVARLTLKARPSSCVRTAWLPGREAGALSFSRPVDRLLAMTRSSGRTRSDVPSTVRSSACSYSTSNASRP